MTLSLMDKSKRFNKEISTELLNVIVNWFYNHTCGKLMSHPTLTVARRWVFIVNVGYTSCSVSDYRGPFFLSLKRKAWWRHQMETFSALLDICAGNSPVTGEFPVQRPVTRSFDVFFVLRLKNRLGIQSKRWWFETPSRPLWRHCNDIDEIFDAACTSSYEFWQFPAQPVMKIPSK